MNALEQETMGEINLIEKESLPLIFDVKFNFYFKIMNFFL